MPEPVKLPPAEWFDRFIGLGDSRHVSLDDAIACVRLVVAELQSESAAREAEIRLVRPTVSLNALYAECERLTGKTACWGVVVELQRKARAQQGLQAPSLVLASPMPAASQPRWAQELNEPGGAERGWLIENGLWCG